jgi:hypothetical protein
MGAKDKDQHLNEGCAVRNKSSEKLLGAKRKSKKHAKSTAT